MVNKVTSTFQRGKFLQDLECTLNTFQDPGSAKSDQGRPSGGTGKPGESQMADTASREATGAAPTPSGTGTTSGTGFASDAVVSTDISQQESATVNSVNSISNVMDPMQRLSGNTGTIPTNQGQTVDDDYGPE